MARAAAVSSKERSMASSAPAFVMQNEPPERAVQMKPRRSLSVFLPRLGISSARFPAHRAIQRQVDPGKRVSESGPRRKGVGQALDQLDGLFLSGLACAQAEETGCSSIRLRQVPAPFSSISLRGSPHESLPMRWLDFPLSLSGSCNSTGWEIVGLVVFYLHNRHCGERFFRFIKTRSKIVIKGLIRAKCPERRRICSVRFSQSLDCHWLPSVELKPLKLRRFVFQTLGQVAESLHIALQPSTSRTSQKQVSVSCSYMGGRSWRRRPYSTMTLTSISSAV